MDFQLVELKLALLDDNCKPQKQNQTLELGLH